jgi:hypothetical protein
MEIISISVLSVRKNFNDFILLDIYFKSLELMKILNKHVTIKDAY